MSATDLEFEDNSFDFISAHQLLEYINEYPEILIAFRRLCKPGGVICINVPNPSSPILQFLIRFYPSFLLFLPIEINLWCLGRNK
jgi:ubiquinone/menaquinone biosynthesis C-methylase UbiE